MGESTKPEFSTGVRKDYSKSGIHILSKTDEHRSVAELAMLSHLHIYSQTARISRIATKFLRVPCGSTRRISISVYEF